MTDGTAIRKIGGDDLVVGTATPGLSRLEAVSTDRLWGGTMTMAAGSVSGWHHHSSFETVVYVLAGELRVDFGVEGAESVVAGAGEFIYIPGWLVHREAAAGSADVSVVAVRAGSGTPVVNVDAPSS